MSELLTPLPAKTYPTSVAVFGEASVALALQGASSVTGYDLSRQRIKVARRLACTRDVDALCRFEVRDGSKPLPLKTKAWT